MKRSLLFSGLAAASLLLAPIANAQSATTEPVGFTTNSLLANSDSFISLPFIRPPAFVGGIQSAAGTTITVSGSPWTANQFVYAAGTQPNRYYALIGPAAAANPKEGHTYPIIGNGTNTLTVDLGADSLTGIPMNAQLSVIPNWTLATAFPASDQNVSFTPTTVVGTYKTQIRVPDASASGINQPYTTYYFRNNAWHVIGDDVTDRGDDPFMPDSYFVVRNENGAPTLPLVSLGGVLLKKLAVPLATSTTTAQDNPVSLLRPLDVALNATGLNATDGSFLNGDQLLVFNNAVAAFDKAPSAIYVQAAGVTEGPWRRVGDTTTDRGGEIIPSGTGFIIRKAISDGQPDFWTNNFPVAATSAVSRKTHGAAGDFDINLPLTGTPGVECRGTGTTHKVVFTFPAAVTFSGAQVTSGVASSATAMAASSNVVVVDLTGVSDVQRITVTLLDVNDGTNTNDVAVRMGVLTGDVGGNGTVNAGDIGQTKGQSGQTVSASNFRMDVAVSGTINASDIAAVKSRSGTTLPP
jgi:uncharacterized protein (TIGR02597 family)